MNIVELNMDALVVASRALLGNERTNMLSELYVLLDNAEHRGDQEGFKRGFNDGYQAGNDARVEEVYDNGYDDGFDDGVLDAENYGEAMYDAGYEQARTDLGEHPMITLDFDGAPYIDHEFIAMCQNRYVGDND